MFANLLHRPRTRKPARRNHLQLEALETRTLLSTFIVDRLTDQGAGSDVSGDLRYCITHATDGDRIQFGVQGTISLTRVLPDLTHNIRIEGPGPDVLTIQPVTPRSYRIFSVARNATVEISGLTVANGASNGISGDGFGGGILNRGTLTVANAAFSANWTSSGLGGGAIGNMGTLTVSGSSFSNNVAVEGKGGAIANTGATGALVVNDDSFSGNQADRGSAIDSDSSNGMLDIRYSTMSGNAASFVGVGGTIFVQGNTATISNCTISGNHGSGPGILNNSRTLTVSNCTISDNTNSLGDGGGLNNKGTMTLLNSTISGNSATEGGGITNSGTLTVINGTVSGNTALFIAGGIGNTGTLTVVNSTLTNNINRDTRLTASQLFSGTRGRAGQATVELRNTILSGDGSKPNVFADPGGSIVSDGHNLSSDDGNGFLTGSGDLINTDPLLGPLQDNGGPTHTMALLPGSPAVDAGDNTDAPNSDQRGPGFDRIVGGTIDIGAFEAQIGPATSLQISLATEVLSGAPFDVTVVALDAYHHIAAGYLGTVTFSSSDVDPGVVLPADYTFTADDQGVHSFPGAVTLITVGAQTLTVTDTADASLTSTASVTVDPSQAPPPGGTAPAPDMHNGKAAGALGGSGFASQRAASVEERFASLCKESTDGSLLHHAKHDTPALASVLDVLYARVV